MKQEEVLVIARKVLQIEAKALENAIPHLDVKFCQTVEAIHNALQAGGKLVVTGVGKSGNIAQKVAATLTSTGSLSVFLHPTDALHGDLGLVRPQDVLFLFSHSGSSQELLALVQAARPLCGKIVGLLGNPSGALAEHLDHVIGASIEMEACPHNLAPTASSTLAMALGDALAMSLQHLAGFSPDHFARFHPGGKLGKKLTTRVSDLMHGEGQMALLAPSANIDDIVMALTQYPHSGVCIVEGKTELGTPKLVGVITEGDIRRALKRKEAFFSLKATDIMSKQPSSITADTKATDALAFMEQRERQISFLPVLDNSGGCVGALRIHDLILAGLN